MVLFAVVVICSVGVVIWGSCVCFGCERIVWLVCLYVVYMLIVLLVGLLVFVLLCR